MTTMKKAAKSIGRPDLPLPGTPPSALGRKLMRLRKKIAASGVNSFLAMPELTGQTFTPRLILAPIGPISIGAGLPSSAGARESPLMTTTRWPCFLAHW
jgi:hypothetical protein